MSMWSKFIGGSGSTDFWKSFGPLAGVKRWLSGEHAAKLSSAYQVQTAAALNEQQKDLNLWNALNLPAAQVEGLRAAGINPITAANTSPTVVSSHQGSAPPQANLGNAMAMVSQLVSTARDLSVMKSEIEMAKNDAAVSELDKLHAVRANELDYTSNEVARIRKEAELEALTHRITADVDGDGFSKYNSRDTYDTLVQAYRNAIERDRYMNSMEHAIYEDTVNSAKTVGDVISNVRAPVKPDQRRFYNTDRRSINFTDRRGNHYYDIRK